MKPEETTAADFFNIEKILEERFENSITAQLILADYRNEKWMLDNGLSSQGNFDRYRSLLAHRITTLDFETEEIEEIQQNSKASIFLSYNRKNSDAARQIKLEFAKYQIRVVMDVTDVISGESIENFINKHITGNDGVMLLVSKESLCSAWVSYEMVTAIYNRMLNNSPIYPVRMVDLYRDDLYRHIIEEITNQITDVDNEVEAIKTGGHPTPYFLYDKKKQLEDARYKLTDILSMLRKHAVSSIDGNEFGPSIERIARHIIENKRKGSK